MSPIHRLQLHDQSQDPEQIRIEIDTFSRYDQLSQTSALKTNLIFSTFVHASPLYLRSNTPKKNNAEYVRWRMVRKSSENEHRHPIVFDMNFHSYFTGWRAFKF